MSDVDQRQLCRIEDAAYAILHRLHNLERTVNTLSTKTDLDAALAELVTLEGQRDAVLTKALADLDEKIAAGTVTTPEDFSAELAQIKALHDNAAAMTQSAVNADPALATAPVDTTAPTGTTDATASTATDAPATGTAPAAS